MTRNEYMEQLKKYLKRLPKEDYDSIQRFIIPAVSTIDLASR